MKSSDQIKAIRAQLNLSQSELAKRLGVSFATVNRWEKERCEPSQIAEICNYPAGKLYTLQADLTGLKILDVEVSLD